MPILKKRNVLTPEMLSQDGDILTVVDLRPAESQFFAFELVCEMASGQQVTIGLQKQSFNVDRLIDIFGTDNTDMWKTKRIKAFPAEWNNRPVIRFEAILEDKLGRNTGAAKTK